MKRRPALARRPRLIPPAATAASAASALFALQSGADAEVIYTDPTDIVVGPSGFENINLNGGGNDFGGAIDSSSVPGQVFLFPLGGNQVFSAGGNLLGKLPGGFSIGGGGVWGFNAGLMRNQSSGLWQAGQTGYAGVRLAAGGGSYNYGWIRMRVDDLSPRMARQTSSRSSTTPTRIPRTCRFKPRKRKAPPSPSPAPRSLPSPPWARRPCGASAPRRPRSDLFSTLR